MAVFISYSSKNKGFVDTLAIRLVKDRIKVWIDRWEINVGDSLINKIQEAVLESSFLIVVLSKDSVQSEWVRIELNAGLINEIEKKRVVILPVVIDDCEIPIFLKEKKYADFRTDFEIGYKELMVPLQSLFSEYMGQLTSEEYNTDYALDWGVQDGSYFFNIDSIAIYKSSPISILSQTTFFGNDIATRRWQEQHESGHDWLMKEAIIEICKNSEDIMGMQALLRNDRPYTATLILHDPGIDTTFNMNIRIRVLGQDTGKDIVYDYSSIFQALDNSREERLI